MRATFLYRHLGVDARRGDRPSPLPSTALACDPFYKALYNGLIRPSTFGNYHLIAFWIFKLNLSAAC